MTTPSGVTILGVLHLTSGILNLLTALGICAGFLYPAFFLVMGIGISLDGDRDTGAVIGGLGLFFAIPLGILFLLSFVTSMAELISGIQILRGTAKGNGAPRITSILECVSLLWCNVWSCTCGVIALAILTNPEVRDWFEGDHFSEW